MAPLILAIALAPPLVAPIEAVWGSGSSSTTGNFRVADGWHETTRKALESKVGYQGGSARARRRIIEQIDRDLALIAEQKILTLEWHFFASATSNTIGAHPEIIEYLNLKKIPYFIHLPKVDPGG